MSIDIPNAVLTAVTDAFIRLSNETPSLEPVDRLDIVQRALREALPALIPVITADLRAQVEAEIRADEREKTIQYLITEAENYDLWFVRFRDRLDEDIVVFLKRYAANPVREEDLIARAEGADATE